MDTKKLPPSHVDHATYSNESLSEKSPLLPKQPNQACIDCTLQIVERHQTRAMWAARVFAVCVWALARYYLLPTNSWADFAINMLSLIDSWTIVMFPTLIGMIAKFFFHPGLSLRIPFMSRELILVPQLPAEDLEAAEVGSWSDFTSGLWSWWEWVKTGIGLRRFAAKGWPAVVFLVGMVVMEAVMVWSEVRKFMRAREYYT